jgi:hypothetical protein
MTFETDSYSSVLASKNSQMELQDRQLADYREKLHGATPDEAKARIDALERQLGDLRREFAPRKLTQVQREKFALAISKLTSSTIQIANDMSVADSAGYANEFRVLFQRAGWKVSSPSVLGPGAIPASGLGIQVGDQRALSDIERGIADAMKEAGIPYDLIRGRPSPGADVGLLITSALH